VTLRSTIASVDQCALAVAVGAEQHHGLARRHRKRDILEHAHRAVAGVQAGNGYSPGWAPNCKSSPARPDGRPLRAVPGLTRGSMDARELARQLKAYGSSPAIDKSKSPVTKLGSFPPGAPAGSVGDILTGDRHHEWGRTDHHRPHPTSMCSTSAIMRSCAPLVEMNQHRKDTLDLR
jgi:hypothetical protein